MKRRTFIAALGGAAAWPVVARAQQPVKIDRLGYLAPARIPHLIDALLTGLRELGYVEGKNIKIEYRYGGTATLDELAAQLVELHPDASITVATPPAIAAKRATTTIPYCHGDSRRPSSVGYRRQFRETRWQRHRRHALRLRTQRQAGRGVEGSPPSNQTPRRSRHGISLLSACSCWF